jgi:hypothetical protein
MCLQALMFLLVPDPFLLCVLLACKPTEPCIIVCRSLSFCYCAGQRRTSTLLTTAHSNPSITFDFWIMFLQALEFLLVSPSSTAVQLGSTLLVECKRKP